MFDNTCVHTVIAVDWITAQIVIPFELQTWKTRKRTSTRTRKRRRERKMKREKEKQKESGGEQGEGQDS